MAIVIQPFTEERTEAVRAFNRRLAAGGIAPEFHFPENHVPHWLPPIAGRRIYQEYFLALDQDEVRGAFILKHQDFSFQGQNHPVVYYHLPVSEGIVNKAFAGVGVHMLRSALKLEPMLYCLGMGGFDRPLPRMLQAMGWSLCEVPFFFRVRRPARFLRHIAPLRTTTGRRVLADLAAFTGLGTFGIRAAQALKTRSARGVSVEPVGSFGPWADELWQRCRQHYGMAAVRDRATLEVLYPAGKNFVRLKISRGSQVLGWAVVIDTPMRGNKYFGNLRLGSIADCMALPADAPAVLQSAAGYLDRQGADLVVSNQAHAAWRHAFRHSGFFQGPSNFIFAASKNLSALLAPFEISRDLVFLTRGDGDGPVNL